MNAGSLEANLSSAPGWLKEVERNGLAARAYVLSDPQKMLKEIGGHKGREVWLDVEARIEPVTGGTFETRMKCHLSQAIFGVLASGMKVNVRYDPADRSRVLLVDDVHTLLSYRVMKA